MTPRITIHSGCYGLSAFVLLTYQLAPAVAQSAVQKQATISYLHDLQNRDGGFRGKQPKSADSAPSKPSLRATSAAVRALKYFGGDVPDRQGSKQFAAACFDKRSGGFADQPGGTPDVATTAVGLMLIVELGMSVDDYKNPALAYLEKNVKTFEDIRIAAAGLEAVNERPAFADSWIKTVKTSLNGDGTFGEGPGAARFTGGAVVALLRITGKPVENRQSVLKALKAGQRSDGGFGKEGTEGSDLETSYRVMRAFHMLKEKPDAEKLRELIAKCRNSDGGYSIVPGLGSQVGSTYFAAIILHWLE